MKRSPLKRRSRLVTRTPLARTAMRRKPTRPKSGADAAYLERVRGLACCARPLSRHYQCGGAIEAHHAGARPGVAMKADDATAIPLCARHHRADWHGAKGAFLGWCKATRRAWSDEMIARTQADLAAPAFCPDVDRADEAMEMFSSRWWA